MIIKICEDIKLSSKEQNCCKKTSIGGQALIEGIMMRGPEKSVMAVRNPEGEIVLEEIAFPVGKRPKILKLPLIRGIFNFIDSMRCGYKALMRSAEIAMPEESDKPQTEEKKKKDSALIGLAAGIGGVLGIVLSVGLFIYLPSLLYRLIESWFPSLGQLGDGTRQFIRSAFEGGFRIVLMVCYMAAMCLVKDVRRTFEYHGAEHKTIFCYEAGLELTVENIKKQKRFHPRCGTSFMILMLLVGIIIGLFIPVDNPFLRTGIKLLLLPLTVGIGYELIKFCGRHDNVLTRTIAAPGMLLQRITVHEPDEKMIECAIAAMTAVIPEDKDSDKF